MGRTIVPARAGWIPRLFAGALLLALPAAAAHAQDAAAKPVDVRRLRFEQKCVFEAFPGKAESEFLNRLRSQNAAYLKAKALPGKSTVADLQDLLAACLWQQVQGLRSKDEKRATELAGELMKLDQTSKASESIKDEADTYVLSVDLAKAKRLEANDPDGAYIAFKNCTGTKKAAPRAEAVAGMVRIACRKHNYDAKNPPGDLMELADVLAKVLEGLTADLPDALRKASPVFMEMEKLRSETLGSLGFIEFSFKDFNLGAYRGEKAPLDIKTATFALVPVGEGQAWPLRAPTAVLPKARLTLKKGTYDVRVYVAAAGLDPVAVYPAVATGADTQPTPLVVPAQVPQGMVFVPDPAGAFFIDRTEVTVAQVAAFKEGNAKLADVFEQSLKDQPQTPAWFYDEEAARAFEKACGKSIPLDRQWLFAAFAGRSAQDQPFPWGKGRGAPRKHFAPTGENPAAVGSFPEGRSPFFLDDMVGNVAEWVVKDGALWVLGGHMVVKAENLFDAGGKNWTRDPAPGKAAFDALGTAQGPYTKYRVTPDDIGVCGLRMVINVK